MSRPAKPTRSKQIVDSQLPSDEEDDEILKPDFLGDEEDEDQLANGESESESNASEVVEKPKKKGKGKKAVSKNVGANTDVVGGQVVQRPALLDRNNDGPQPTRKAPSKTDTIAALEKRLKATQTALEKSQEVVVQLNQKRKRVAVDDGNNNKNQSRAKKSKSTHKNNNEDYLKHKHARDLGKRFVFGYAFWTDPDTIFKMDVEAESDEEEPDNAEGCDEDVDVNARTEVTEPRAGWTLKSQPDIDTYIKAQVKEFKMALEKKDRRAWSKKWFQESFCEGARKFRADLLKGTADHPVELFGLRDVKTDEFMNKSTRPHLPQVKELLKDDNFLLGHGNGPRSLRLYRNDCIVKMLLRMYWGPKAVLTGERSKMARSTYGTKFKGKSVTLMQLAAAAVVVKVILEGDDEFSATDTDRVRYFWDRLSFLYRMKRTSPDMISKTIKWINRKLELNDDEEGGVEGENALEEEILRELEG